MILPIAYIAAILLVSAPQCTMGSSSYGTITRTSLSPSYCDTGSCITECSKEYTVVRNGASVTIDPTDIGSCSCYSAQMTVSSYSPYHPISDALFSDGEDVSVTVSGKIITTFQSPSSGVVCEGTYSVTEGTVFGIDAPSSIIGTIKRSSLSPSACNQGGCMSSCSDEYTITQSGSFIKAVPKYHSGCDCDIGTGSIGEDYSSTYATIDFPSSKALVNVADYGETITVDVEYSYLSCIGTYVVTSGTVFGKTPSSGGRGGSGGSGLNVGAIVGLAIGGIAFLSLIIAIIVIVIMRKRRKKNYELVLQAPDEQADVIANSEGFPSSPLLPVACAHSAAPSGAKFCVECGANLQQQQQQEQYE